jgi:hypothetical protein
MCNKRTKNDAKEETIYNKKTKLNIKNSKRHADDIETPDRDDTRRHRKGQMDIERKL